MLAPNGVLYFRDIGWEDIVYDHSAAMAVAVLFRALLAVLLGLYWRSPSVEGRYIRVELTMLPFIHPVYLWMQGKLI